MQGHIPQAYGNAATISPFQVPLSFKGPYKVEIPFGTIEMVELQKSYTRLGEIPTQTVRLTNLITGMIEYFGLIVNTEPLEGKYDMQYVQAQFNGAWAALATARLQNDYEMRDLVFRRDLGQHQIKLNTPRQLAFNETAIELNSKDGYLKGTALSVHLPHGVTFVTEEPSDLDFVQMQMQRQQFHQALGSGYGPNAMAAPWHGAVTLLGEKVRFNVRHCDPTVTTSMLDPDMIAQEVQNALDRKLGAFGRSILTDFDWYADVESALLPTFAKLPEISESRED